MNKRIISLVLALVMVLGTFTSVFAAEADKEAKKPENGEKVEKVVGKDQKIQYVIEKKFVEGYEDGSYGYDKNIKRAEITRLLVLANGHEDLAKKLQGSMRIYSDVDTNHWANGVITVGTTKPSDANGIPFLVGYPDKSFKPENDVTYAELAKMLVVLVKKDLTKEMHDNAIWASSWMTWAAELGILEDVTIVDSNAPATRADAFVMLYNALYAMKYIKRMPANETMGILSQLKNNELTINQGEKAKTFKLTNETVFVLYNQHNTLDVNADKKVNKVNVFAQAVKVSAINNPSFYYGSLIRVLTNDKNEVTHILELGNPRDLALGHMYKAKWQNKDVYHYVIDPNQRWADVADATVETSGGSYFWDECCKYVDDLDVVAAKINYTDSHTAKSIDFIKGQFAKKPENETRELDLNNFKPVEKEELVKHVRLTSKTRYFVADVRKNQLTEVSGVEQAITILGLTRASNWFFDVYAGYDTVSARKDHEHSARPQVEGVNEATVVVFNSVLKNNNDEQLLRARQQSTNLYDVRLEDTDGKTVVDNYREYRNGMQFKNAVNEFGEAVEVSNLDVVEITRNSAYGIEVEVKIDHDDYNNYPVVKVIDVQNGGRTLIVEDQDKDTASLRLDTDYEKFITKDNLVGRYVQFHTQAKNGKYGTANVTNVVDILSVLPESYEKGLKGNLMNIVHANQGNQHAGWVETHDIEFVGGSAALPWKVNVMDYRDLYNSKRNSNKRTFTITETSKDLLQSWLECFNNTDPSKRMKIRFKVQSDIYKTEEMYDIEVKYDEKWYDLRSFFAVNSQIKINDVVYTDFTKAVEDFKDKVPTKADLTIGNLEVAKALLETRLKLVKPFTCDFIANHPELEAYLKDVLQPGVKELEDAKTALEGKITEAKAKIATPNLKVSEAGDGSEPEILTGEKYVSRTAYNALQALIQPAENTIISPSAKKANLDTVRANLETAITGFVIKTK